jgi:alkylation response protein AidB-like acyl-CoA dehydrogenase
MVSWTEEQRAIHASARLLGEHLCGTKDKHEAFDQERWRRLCASGLPGMPFGAEWGGGGRDLSTTMCAFEGLGYGCRDGGLSFCTVTHVTSVGVPLHDFGSAELRTRYLPTISAGARIGAHAITEADSGSDVLSMKTTAQSDGDGFVLSGTKSFVTNGPVAGLFVVYARTDPAGGTFGLSAFLVERDTPGVMVGPPIPAMGLRSAPLGELVLDRCHVPRANLIGSLGSGFLILNHTLQWEILLSFIVHVGEMQYRLERCVDFAKTRRQFDQPIGSFQSVANNIVEMKIVTDTARKWLYSTAEKLERGEDVVIDIAISKLLASEGNLESALTAMRIFGGRGYLEQYGLEQEMRDAVAGVTYSGTSDIQRQRIAAMLGL